MSVAGGSGGGARGDPGGVKGNEEQQAIAELFEECVNGRVAIELDATPSRHSGYGEPTNLLACRVGLVRPRKTLPGSAAGPEKARLPSAFSVLSATTRYVLMTALQTPPLHVKGIELDARILPVMGAVVYATQPPGQTPNTRPISRGMSGSPVTIAEANEENDELDPAESKGSAAKAAAAGAGLFRPISRESRPSSRSNRDLTPEPIGTPPQSAGSKSTERPSSQGSDDSGAKRSASRPPSPAPLVPLAGAWDLRVSLPQQPMMKKTYALQAMRENAANRTLPDQITLPMIVTAVKQLAAFKGSVGGWFLAIQIGGPWGELGVGAGKGMQVFVSRKTDEEEMEELKRLAAEAAAEKKRRRALGAAVDSDTDEESDEDDDSEDSVTSSSSGGSVASHTSKASRVSKASKDGVSNTYGSDGDEGNKAAWENGEDSDDGSGVDTPRRTRHNAKENGVPSRKAVRRGAVSKGTSLNSTRRGGFDGGQRESWRQDDDSPSRLLGPTATNTLSPTTHKSVDTRRSSSLSPWDRRGSDVLGSALAERLRDLASQAGEERVASPTNQTDHPAPRTPHLAVSAYQEWASTRTLREVLDEGRRVSAFNILKWTTQLARSVHWCHSRYLTLGALSSDDVWMVPDTVVINAARDQGRRVGFDAKSVAERRLQLKRLVQGLGRRKRRLYRQEKRAAMSSRDAWLNPASLVDLLGSGGGSVAKTLVPFPHLAKLDYRRDGRISTPDRPKEIEKISLQLNTFSVLQQRDLRHLGMIIAQMLIHRSLTDYEMTSLSRGGLDTLRTIVQNLGKAPQPVQALLKLCFSVPQPMEQTAPPSREGQGRGMVAVILSLPQQVALGIIIKSLRELEKQEVEARRWVRPTRWTRSDERLRILLIEQRLSRLSRSAAIGPRNARMRLLEDRRKLEFALLPPDQQAAVKRREALHEQTQTNARQRRLHMRLARFHHNSQTEMRAWVRDAITAAVARAWELKRPLLKDRTKKLNVDDATRVREMLGPFAPTVMSKLLLGMGMTCNAFKAQARGSGVVLSALELDSDMKTFAQAFATQVSSGLCSRLTSVEFAGLLELSVEEASIRMDKSSLASMLKPALFQRRKIATQADALFKVADSLRETLEAMAEAMLLQDGELAGLEVPLVEVPASRGGTRGGSNSRSGVRTAATNVTQGSIPATAGSTGLRPLTGLSPSRPGSPPRSASPTGYKPSSPKPGSPGRPASRKGTVDPASRIGWIRLSMRMVCVSLLEKYDEQRWMRESGRHIAAAKISSLARRMKVLKIMRRVWGKARAQHMKLINAEARAAKAAKEAAQDEAAKARLLKAASDIDTHKPEPLNPPRLLAVYRPSRQSDPQQHGKATLDVLITVMMSQSSFGSVFLEDGGSLAAYIEATVVQNLSPLPLSSNERDGRADRGGLGNPNHPHHGELLVLVHDRRSGQSALSLAVKRLVREYERQARTGRSLHQTSIDSNGFFPGEEDSWTREGFKRKIQQQQDRTPLSAQGCPERLRVRVRGLQANSSYRVRVFLAADFMPRQAWERVPAFHQMVSRHLVVFRPVAAVGNEVALSTKMDVLMAREAAEWRELDTMEHDERVTRAAFYAEDLHVRLRAEHKKAIDEAAAKRELDRQTKESTMDITLDTESLLKASNVWRAESDPEGGPALQAWLHLSSIPPPRPSPATEALREGARTTDSQRLPVPALVSCLSARTHALPQQQPVISGATIVVTEGGDVAYNGGWQGPETVWAGESADVEKDDKERRRLLLPLVLLAGHQTVSECACLVTVCWAESIMDGGCRAKGFGLLRSLVLESRQYRTSSEAAAAVKEDGSDSGWEVAWAGPFRSLLNRDFDKRALREHTDRLVFPAVLPSSLLHAWRAKVDAPGPQLPPEMRVCAFYKARTRSQAGLSGFSRVFRVPLLSLRLTKLSGQLTVDTRDVLNERARGSQPVVLSSTTVMDTAAAGTASVRLRMLADAAKAAKPGKPATATSAAVEETIGGPLSLRPVTQVQLLVAQARKEQQSSESGGTSAWRGGSSGGVAGRIKDVGRWMGRVRVAEQSKSRSSSGPLTILSPRLVTLPEFPPSPTPSFSTPASSKSQHEPNTNTAWKLLDDLCLPSPASASTGIGRHPVPLPMLRKWGGRPTGEMEGLGGDEEEEDVEALALEIAGLERLRREYEDALSGLAGGTRAEIKNEDLTGAVHDTMSLRVRGRGEDWLSRVAKASPLVKK